jgi:O-Antigen ligase/Tetratricopeptide repeat
VASPAGVTADDTGTAPKARTRKKHPSRGFAVRPRAVRAVLLAILGAGSGVSVLLGGLYNLTVWGPIAAGVLALALALVVTGAGPPRVMPTVALGSLTFLWLFSWLSSIWAESSDQALNYAGRWAFYAAVLLSLLLLMRRREERWIPLAFATAGVVGVGLYIVVRMGFGEAAGMFFGGRLRDPLGYVNGQAGYFLLGFWPCVALAEQARYKVFAGLGAAGALVLGSLMMLSQTRGVIPGLAFSGLIVFAFVPGRARRVLVLAGIGLALAAIGSPVLDVYNQGALRADPEKVASAGKAILLAALLLAFVWWFVGFVMGGIAGAAGAPQRRALVWAERALAAVGVVIAVIGLIAIVGNPFHRISKEYDDFVNLKVDNAPMNTRFLSGGGYRYDYWRIAWKEFKQEPLRGVGAGSYDVDYFVDRRTNEDIRQPHSLPMQLLAELGIPGLLALLAFVGAVFAGLWRASRRGVTSLGRRVAAVAAGGAFAAWLAHTSVDWLHLLPGVTGIALCAAAGLLAPWSRQSPGRALATGRILAVVLTAVAVLAAADLAGRLAVAEHYRLQSRDALNTDPVHALRLANDSLALNGDSLPAMYTKSAAYARLGRYNAARATLLQATRTEPHNSQPWGLLGDLAVRRGAYRIAKIDYSKAARLNPNDGTLPALAKDPRSVLSQGP